jgi:hypothetical protein
VQFLHAPGKENGAASFPTDDLTFSPLTREFLAWIASGPRTYSETMETWRTSCPRQTIWKDALADCLNQIESGRGRPMSQVLVALTSRGRAALAKTINR